MAVREGAWDCPYCGKKRNRGPDKHCMGCGAPRDKDVEFYLPEDAEAITDEAVLEKAGKAPDWHCTYCGGDNPADAKFCVNCGAGVDGTEPSRQVKDILDAPEKPVEEKPSPGMSKGLLFGLLGGGALLLAVGAFLVWFFVLRTHEELLEVTAHRWERTIAVERFKTVIEEAWEGSVPTGGREISRSKEVYRTEKIQVGTKRVKVGKRDKGNGYFEDIYEDRPQYKEKKIYRDKVRYHIERWKHERTEKASGDDFQPRWPEVRLRGKERKSKSTERLKVLLVSPEGKSREWIAKNETEWKGFEKGSKYKAKVRASGGVVALEPAG
ncbi:MAG: zinc ribbon domain-containing protein [Planctomycetota bacterium]|jgi:predicted nucleic acid-binding Zn ribbon protein